jgi:hypothetical protein
VIGKENRCKGLEVMEDNALLMGQLYKRYADRFPDCEELWSGMASEQIEQARSIRELRANVETGKVSLKENRLPSAVLEVFRGYIKGLLYDTLEREISLEAAIETALYIQWSLLKQDCFGRFREDLEGCRGLANRFDLAACRRRDRLLKVLEETRRPLPRPESVEDTQYSETVLSFRETTSQFNHLGYYPLDL